MNSQPLVSVVIPVFNLEAFLGEAVDSVMNQTFRDFEIILVDDGSSDGSRDIITRCQQQAPGRVRAFFREHEGAAAARNAGIAASGGKWIAFLDGDDVWKPRKLEVQLEEARRNPHVNLLSTAVEILGQERLLFDAAPGGPGFRLELLLKGCFITLSSVLIARELLDDARFDEHLPGAQELDLYLRLPDYARYRYIPEPLVLYRIRQGAISDPQTTRHAQLGSHYRIVKREAETLGRTDPPLFKRHHGELRAVMARLAHEAAYFSLCSQKAAWPLRLKMAALAVRADPARLKNYRLLLQALLPRRMNRWLRQRQG